MNTAPNRKVRSIYCVALLQATVIPFAYGVLINLFAAFQIAGQRIDYVGRTVVCLFFLAAFSYRMWAVIRNPETLEFRPSSKIATSVRALSIALLWIGALAIPSLVVGIAVLLSVNKEAGIAVGFLVPLWLALTVGIGLVGVIVFEVARLSAWRVGSTVGISARGWNSRKLSQKIIVIAIGLLILLAGVIYVTLWQQRETYQHKNRIKSELALDFVRNHSAVIEKVGANVAPRLTSMVFPKDATPNDGLLFPIGYVISIDEHLYAIVSTPQAADDHKFTLDCITPLTHDERYGNRDRCK